MTLATRLLADIIGNHKVNFDCKGHRRAAGRIPVAILAIVERTYNKIVRRAAVTICNLSVAGVGIRHPAHLNIGDEFVISFSGHSSNRLAFRCIVTRCNAAAKNLGFVVGAEFRESLGVSRIPGVCRAS